MVGAWPGVGDEPVEMLVLLPSGSWREPRTQVHGCLLNTVLEGK